MDRMRRRETEEREGDGDGEGVNGKLIVIVRERKHEAARALIGAGVAQSMQGDSEAASDTPRVPWPPPRTRLAEPKPSRASFRRGERKRRRINLFKAPSSPSAPRDARAVAAGARVSARRPGGGKEDVGGPGCREEVRGAGRGGRENGGGAAGREAEEGGKVGRKRGRGNRQRQKQKRRRTVKKKQ